MGIPFPDYDGGFTSVVLMALAAGAYLLVALLALALIAGVINLARTFGSRFAQGWRSGDTTHDKDHAQQ